MHSKYNPDTTYLNLLKATTPHATLGDLLTLELQKREQHNSLSLEEKQYLKESLIIPKKGTIQRIPYEEWISWKYL